MDIVKLVLLGDTGVGKTCLISQWSKGTFRAEEQSTIGAAFTQKTFTFSGALYKLHIWDTAGQERYQSMAPIYSQGANGALFVFDLTRSNTLASLSKWRSCLDNCPQDIPVVIAGNKSDLTDRRQVSFEDGLAYACSVNCQYFETSAQNGSGVEDAFSTLTQSALTVLAERDQATTSPVVIGERPRPSTPCC
jgi:small GTP-binding protein